MINRWLTRSYVLFCLIGFDKKSIYTQGRYWFYFPSDSHLSLIAHFSRNFIPLGRATFSHVDFLDLHRVRIRSGHRPFSSYPVSFSNRAHDTNDWSWKIEGSVNYLGWRVRLAALSSQQNRPYSLSVCCSSRLYKALMLHQTIGFPTIRESNRPDPPIGFGLLHTFSYVDIFNRWPSSHRINNTKFLLILFRNASHFINLFKHFFFPDSASITKRCLHRLAMSRATEFSLRRNFPFVCLYFFFFATSYWILQSSLLCETFYRCLVHSKHRRRYLSNFLP